MFGQKTSSSSSGFSNMFGGKLSKLTTGKLKDAMQAAGEQLSAKAASAVEKANQAMAEAVSAFLELILSIKNAFMFICCMNCGQNLQNYFLPNC